MSEGPSYGLGVGILVCATVTFGADIEVRVGGRLSRHRILVPIISELSQSCSTIDHANANTVGYGKLASIGRRNILF